MKATHNPPTSTPTGRTTCADILLGAARYLELHGWTTGQFYDLTGGDPDAPFPPACAVGAIVIAATGQCIAHPFTDVDDAESDDAIRATRALADAIDPDYDPRHCSAIDVIGDWNDHEGRTLDEVLDAFTAAADGYLLAPTGGTR